MNMSSFRAVAFAAGLFLLSNFSASAVTFLVTTNGDTGAGTLRQAITDANTTPGRDEIFFAIGTGPKIIQVFTPLPAITDPVDLNAATQPGYSNAPIITLVGTGGSQTSPGLELVTTDSSIVGFWVHGFRFVPGILLTGGGDHVIAGCQVGSFTPTLGNANGIVLSNSVGNQIGLADMPNLISANFGAGILLSTSSSNVIEGNFIGTNPAGTSGEGNQSDGIRLIGADYNTIGGTSPGAGNLISGNGGNGIYLNTSHFNVIEGNRIGCDVSGASVIPNRLCGVNVAFCESTVIGGVGEHARNIISGNAVHGIEVAGSPVFPEFNVIQGNLIGTDATGMSALPNGGSGIFMSREVGAQIGGTEPGAANLISGNLGQGLWLVQGRSNVVQGNFIGLNRAGNAALANAGAGIRLNSSSQNLVGGSEVGSRNILSGNSGAGIILMELASRDNSIEGNYIGTDSQGSLPMPNLNGISISNAVDNSIIGNLVSGNTLHGVVLVRGSNNVVVGNFVGTDATGTKALPNRERGVYLVASGENTIGGTGPESRNVISGNGEVGVDVAGSRNNVVQGNFIGLNRLGSAALPNGRYGVYITGSSSGTTVGGAEPGAGNVISGNGGNADEFIGAGLSIVGPFSTNNVIQGNRIGTDATGRFAVPNLRAGIRLSAPRNLVGGTLPGEGNVIAFNREDGVAVHHSSASPIVGNAIAGNSIHSNGRLGINLTPTLEPDGVTPNDIGDADTGGNNLQNFPVLTNVVYLGLSTIVQGYLRSSTNGSFSIDIYANVATESSGHGEGQFYVGNVDVDTGATGVGLFSFITPNVFSNQFFTATALNYDTDDTSEFSAPVGGVRITSISQTTGLYHVRFTTITNRNYFLERATNLHSPVMWTTIQTLAVTRGTGGEKTITDPGPPGTMRFYRIREQR